MSRVLCAGSVLKCSCGTVPSPLTVLPVNRVVTSFLPAANIMDHKPFMNILPFGMCTTPTNPMVAAATSAAMGVLTPVPCLPATSTPWMTPVPTVHIGSAPHVNEGSKLMCAYGGMIQATLTAQYTVSSP